MKQVLNFIKVRPAFCLWLAIGSYFLNFSLICIWKYLQFGYNALDLAIYNQVFYNSVHGQLFGFTIHPQSYLGDHFELFIIALLPVYYLFQHPITLLILQTATLALCAWPLFLIAKNQLRGSWPLVIAILWLLNPFVQNINLFEFHLLPFAIFFILWAFYFYQQKNFRWFLLFVLLALLVREDAALVIFMFGLLAGLAKRPLKWIIWPLLLAAAWFFAALKIIAYFAPAGNYKFLVYYGWLGSHLPQIINNFFTEPLKVASRLITPGNLLLLPMLFLPFGFLNLVKPKYLLLALPVYLQLALSQANNAIIVIKLHYVSLLLPGLFIALIYSLNHLLFKKLTKNPAILKIVLLVAIVYGNLTLGPIIGAVSRLFKPDYTVLDKQIRQQILQSIPTDAPTVANNELLTNLSGRRQLYALHYAFTGKQQFSDLPYQLPNSADWWAVNFDDLLTYSVQFKDNPKLLSYYFNGDDNLRKLLAERKLQPAKVLDSLVLFKKTASKLQLYALDASLKEIEQPDNLNLGDLITFMGWARPLNDQQPNNDLKILPVSLYFKAKQKMDVNFQLKLSIKDRSGRQVYDKLYPLAYGLYPTSEWQPKEIVKINYWLPLPLLPAGNYQLQAQLLDYDGLVTLNNVRSAVLKITKEKLLGPIFDLGSLTIE